MSKKLQIEGAVTDSVTVFFAMNSNDLFSFLEDASEEDGFENGGEMEVDNPTMSPKGLQKRKADSPLSISEHQHPGEEDLSNGAGPSAPKKPRISSPKPVVLDDFETEAKREVAASAGLTGAAEAGSRLELRHQVCISNIWSTSNPLSVISGSTSSRSSCGLRLRPDIKTCSANQARPGIQVRTRSIPKGFGLRHTKKRKCSSIRSY